MSVSWKRAPVPAKEHQGDSAWTRLIPSELIREMRLNPGVTYQLLDAQGKPLTLYAGAISAMQRSASRPFRIQTRRAGSRDEKARHVWVSFDPGHWEKLAKVRERKEGTRK